MCRIRPPRVPSNSQLPHLPPPLNQPETSLDLETAIVGEGRLMVCCADACSGKTVLLCKKALKRKGERRRGLGNNTVYKYGMGNEENLKTE